MVVLAVCFRVFWVIHTPYIYPLLHTRKYSLHALGRLRQTNGAMYAKSRIPPCRIGRVILKQLDIVVAYSLPVTVNFSQTSSFLLGIQCYLFFVNFRMQN